MSNFDFYKNNFPNHFSRKSDVSIMLSIVFSEKRVVIIRFLCFFEVAAKTRNRRVNLGTIFSKYIKMASGFYCKECDVTCGRPADWKRHISTIKHMRAQNIVPKITHKFVCSDCDYECCKNSILERHKLSNRHKTRVKTKTSYRSIGESSANPIDNIKLSSQNDCALNCASVPDNSRVDYMSIISQLLNQNNELKNFVIEQAMEHKNFVIEQASEHKKETSEIVNKVIEQTNKVLDTVKSSNINTTITTNNNNNNNNQKFNINVFLNEQCKDAMNFSDFIKNIEVSREDLENNAQLGFVDGVSKILIESLKQLDQTERPIHCTDIKREIMYIKDEDKWTREEDSSKLNRAIQEVTRKSMISLLDWKEENPDYKDRDSEFSERCIVIQQQSMAAHNRDTYFPKVAKLVAKEVMVDK